jgi:hypothetical protein
MAFCTDLRPSSELLGYYHKVLTGLEHRGKLIPLEDFTELSGLKDFVKTAS